MGSLFHKARKLRIASRERVDANSSRIAKNTVVLYFRMLLVMAVGLFTSRVQLAALGASDFGLYNVAASVVTMLLFLNGTLATATSRFLTVEMGNGTIGSLKRLFSTVLAVHLVLAVLSVVVLETVGILFLETKLNIPLDRMKAVMWAYHCVTFTTFVSITQVPYSAVIVAHERMGVFAYMSLFDVFTKLVIVYALLFLPFDRLKTYAILLAGASVVTMLFYRWYCVTNFTEARWRRTIDKTRIKPILSFAGWQVVAAVLTMLGNQGYTMINQRCFGPVLVSAGAIAMTVNGQVMGFVNNFKAAAFPQIVKLYSAREYEKAKTLLIDTTLFSFFLLMVFGTPVVFYADELLRIWLTEVPPYTATILRIMLLVAFASVIDTSFYQIIYASGRIASNAVANGIIGGVSVAVVFGLVMAGCRWELMTFCARVVSYVTVGFIAKPLLLHIIAGYGRRDYMKIFCPVGKTIVVCLLAGFTTKNFLPNSGIISVVIGVVMMSGLILLGIFVFIITGEQRLRIIAKGRQFIVLSLGRLRGGGR